MVNKKIIKSILTDARYKNFILIKNCLIKSDENEYIYNKFKVDIKYGLPEYYSDGSITQSYQYTNPDKFFIYNPRDNNYFYNSEYKFIILSNDFFIFSNGKTDFIGEYYYKISHMKSNGKRSIDIYTWYKKKSLISRCVEKITLYSPRFFKNNDKVNIVIDEKYKKIFVFKDDSFFEFYLDHYYYLIFNPFLLRKIYSLFFFKKYNTKNNFVRY